MSYLISQLSKEKKSHVVFTQRIYELVKIKIFIVLIRNQVWIKSACKEIFFRETCDISLTFLYHNAPSARVTFESKSSETGVCSVELFAN